MDFDKIKQEQEQRQAEQVAQIAAQKMAFDKQMADIMTAQNAQIQAQKLANELAIKAAEDDYRAKVEAQENKRREAKEQAEAYLRAEQAKIRSNEHKESLIQEAKQREEVAAAALKKQIDDLKFAQEQAMKSMQDSFVMAMASQARTVTSNEDQVASDGTQFKPVVENTDGTQHPLKHHLHNVNR
jgi:hypothetical protein